jgi:undecaprenyl-diphosphatase
MEWLESLVLGVVQGITEFLPVSSDGHLLLTQNLFAWITGVKKSGEQNLFFDVILHLGTTAAILVHYRAAIAQGLRGLLGADDVAPGFRRSELVRVGLLAAVATSPLIPLALFLKKLIEKTFEGIAFAGVGFLITAAVLMLTAWLRRRDGVKGPAETTWVDALLIGLAQMFAPLPGVSRSGLTIAAALALGLSRTWAVGFSLMIAVPAILGAAVWELWKLRHVDVSSVSPEHIAMTIAATVLAGVVGFFAIIWLTKIVRSGRIWYFSVYLVLLGIVVLTIVAFGPSHLTSIPAG